MIQQLDWIQATFAGRMVALAETGLSYGEAVDEYHDDWKKLSPDVREKLRCVPTAKIREPWMTESPDGRRVNTDTLLRRAEHEISYGAKRAIEMYLPVWEKGPALELFNKCAEHHALCRGEIEKCRALMVELGMENP